MVKRISDNKKFISDYEALKRISLNPTRHTASNAFEHCELVRERVMELALLNDCLEEECRLLENLAYIHDIGKIKGTANPTKSVELLSNYGTFDDDFVNLVKFHDINLPWYQSMVKGQCPGDKAWKRLSRKTDMKLLCIFMVADRVDCPGGWKSNAPLIWFLEECKKRNLTNSELAFNDGPVATLLEDEIFEHSAGGILIVKDKTDRALVIRVRDNGFEIPKGHIENNESEAETALREIREETGLKSPVKVLDRLGDIEYSFDNDNVRVHKKVTYFLVIPTDELQFAPLPKRTKEIRWVKKENIKEISLVNDDLRDLIKLAFERKKKLFRLSLFPLFTYHILLHDVFLTFF